MGLGLDFSAGFVAAVLVLKVVMGLGFVAAGWGGEGAGGCGFVTAGAAKDLVTAVGVGGCWGTWLLPWVRWVLGELASAMDMANVCLAIM
uniref:Uncharacterized protein n=1 Tax=Fagus sylvatica TaxID=28930 RepID=A0A2N9FLY8_FAGSY